MKPSLKFALILVLFICFAPGGVYAAEAEATVDATEASVEKEAADAPAETPGFFSKENLKAKGAQLVQALPFYDDAVEMADSAKVTISSHIDDARATADEFTSAEVWKEKLGRYSDDIKSSAIVTDALDKFAKARETVADTSVTIRSHVDEAQNTAHNLTSVEAWSQRFDSYADDIKNHEIVLNAKDKYEKAKAPIVNIVNDPMNTAVGQKVKELGKLPKKLIIKIVIIVVIVLVIIGIIKAVINKINEMRNKLLVKAGKFVFKKGVEHVKGRQATKPAPTAEPDPKPENPA